MIVTTETIIDKLVEIYTNELEIVEIGESVASSSKAKVFDEFPFQITPEDDLTVLKSSLDNISDEYRVNSITIAEKSCVVESPVDSPIQNFNTFGSNFQSVTDYEVYTYRIWHWLQFNENSQRLAYRYRDSMRKLIKSKDRLGFTDVTTLDQIKSVGRLQTEFVDLFYYTGGAVNIIANTLSVTLIN